ncbi:putative non-reducing end alpha-L-arabinofuranosidase [Lupinus albus]|uniref:Putative non-reducing end alpha-L-arabinofuranosidase n=1 Tax=Lupinus albus TaxID=3870 RepID=A0A6A4NQ32_LUPAL|nr:putative non-reducing end alpha-L-arabinofuranosidase [Lupinus albus]
MSFYSLKATCNVMLYSLILYLLAFRCCVDANQTSILVVNATSNLSARRIPDTLFGVFLEEINHGVTGGLWAELVKNRGFEAGRGTSNIYPWSTIGDNSSISISTDLTSCFKRNQVALKMKVLCGGTKPCPSGGVGISNPGYWGMNIEEGKKYQIVFYVKALAVADLQISFTGANDVKLATLNVS